MRSRHGTSRFARASLNRWRSSSFAIRMRRGTGTSIGATADTSGTSTLGLAGKNLRLRDHDAEELSHYSVGNGGHRVRVPVFAAG